ncbi:MAG TPA: FMN-binding negative transcriptional regulator [Mycobacteriales bacterium]|jgi:transcriptional regulator|nr:FMN-binding negative transcriptional regulator [Mycobacteriales bacterium]
MLVHPWDAPNDPDEWRDFVAAQGFGQLIAPGRDRELPVVVPTQFIVDGDTVLLHLARPNPVWDALDERPVALLSVAGDWAYVPSAWKALGDEDPAEGVPTTYYAAAQLTCDVTVVDDDEGKLAILRQQLAAIEPGLGAADPSVHLRKLPGIRGLRLAVREVKAKFKYGGNVDREHRMAVAQRLADRAGPGDQAARRQLLRRTEVEG